MSEKADPITLLRASDRMEEIAGRVGQRLRQEDAADLLLHVRLLRAEAQGILQRSA